MGRLHTKDVLENLLKDQSFRLVHWLSITLSLRKSRIHQFGKKVLPGLFLGYALYAGGIWKGDTIVIVLGESEGSPPSPPQDSYPGAGEARNDFWSMSGHFIYSHHVEPRVKLYSPREESFSIPLKYIDVSRTTRANLDVMQERRIDDY